ncbi:MAG: efflux RND transporter periplasmic adaptor subunit [Endomicrobiia bacterium]
MNRKNVITTIIVIVLLISIFRIFQAVNKKVMASKELKKTEIVYTVKVVKVSKEQIFDSTNFVGEIRGINEVSVYSKVPGKLIKKVVEEGNFVAKDDVLCEIDRDEPVLKYSVYELKSPISGIVSKYFVDVGGIVSPQMPVCNVSDTKQVRIIFGIAERLVSKIKPSSYIKFKTPTVSNRSFISRELHLGNYIDPMTRLMEIRSVLNNENNLLKSGGFVEGELIFSEKNVLTIPLDCIINTEDGKKIVYVVENGIAQKRELKTGIEYKGKVEILDGIKQNEIVVYQGQELLVEGMKVNIFEEQKK